MLMRDGFSVLGATGDFANLAPVTRPHARFLLAVALLVSAVSLPAKKAAPTSAALAAQWADLPDYAQLLEGGLKFKVPPRLISGAPPDAPDFLEPGETAFVQVLAAINERGEVVAARVGRSDDPRLDPLAVEAILAWKFTPAEDAIGAVKALVQLPLQFDGPPRDDEQNSISVNMGPFAYDARRQEISAPILLTGPAASEVKAARTLVESAVDDTGAQLGATTIFTLSPAMIGRTAITASPMLSVSLQKPATGARTLRSLDGTLEVVIPALDPDATVQVDELPAKLGRPVSSPALAAAGITIIILDRQGCERALTDANDASGARGFLTKSATSGPVWKNPAGVSRMNSRDVALAIHDPQGRLAGVEFQTMYGDALSYNHNGLSHYSIAAGKRFTIYRLDSKLSNNLKLVCWLATPKSLVTYPLHAANVPLPAGM